MWPWPQQPGLHVTGTPPPLMLLTLLPPQWPMGWAPLPGLHATSRIASPPPLPQQHGRRLMQRNLWTHRRPQPLLSPQLYHRLQPHLQTPLMHRLRPLHSSPRIQHCYLRTSTLCPSLQRKSSLCPHGLATPPCAYLTRRLMPRTALVSATKPAVQACTSRSRHCSCCTASLGAATTGCLPCMPWLAACAASRWTSPATAAPRCCPGSSGKQDTKRQQDTGHQVPVMASTAVLWRRTWAAIVALQAGRQGRGRGSTAPPLLLWSVQQDRRERP